jgi:hypothetical protein
VAIETTCSGCGRQLSVPDEHAGKKGRCPVCGQIYTIPFLSTKPDLNTGGSLSSGASDTPGALGGRAEGNWSPQPQSQLGSELGDATVVADRFWMETADGNVYGPVDRAGLDRWFSEGRVGPGYRIRQGEFGAWGRAEDFRPVDRAAVNPYAPLGASGGTGIFNYPKADNGILILAMGILGFVICPILSVVAWVMGSGALRDIASGQMDPKNKGLVQAGYYLGIINCVLNVFCIGAYLIIIAISIVAQ